MRSPSARHAVWGRRGCYPEAECGLARVPAPLSLPPAPMDPRPRRAPTREQHRPRHRSLTRLLPNRKLGGSSADPRRTERTPTEPDADTRFQPAETPAGPETRAAGAGGRPYVSANPTLRGGRLRQDPESETGAGDLPDPVTTLVLLRNRLPLAGSADYNPEAKPNLSAFVYKVLMEQSCEPAVCGLRLPLDTAAELIPTQTSGPPEGGAFPPSSPLSTSRRSR
ncbi:uncharacterized protein LOC134728846 isoform X1 [Pan paniscus]|uniref:uncharacterized protein LOC134728846 isoform X1 n=1 Tax=Pan paniscus TaxID=9597 RepID=UPI0030053591